MQQLHYASGGYALLLIFQAMDAAGKDGAIGHVMSGVTPQGCRVFSFKHPPPNGSITFFGVPHGSCRNGGASVSSIGPITTRC
jgi:polyphosphate kinase 2 (PPK2 family)